MVRPISYPLPKKTAEFIENQRVIFQKKIGYRINKTRFVEIQIHGRLVNAILNGGKNAKKQKR